MASSSWRQFILRCISKEVYPSPATGGYHTGGIPFDTGALMDSIYLTWREDGVDIHIGSGIEYNEWLNESSHTRRQWIRIMTQNIAANIAAYLKANMDVSESE